MELLATVVAFAGLALLAALPLMGLLLLADVAHGASAQAPSPTSSSPTGPSPGGAPARTSVHHEW